MNALNRGWFRWLPWAVMTAVLLGWAATSALQSKPPDKDKPAEPPTSSYDQISPVLLGQQTFADMVAKDKADKPAVMARQKKLLEERYDLTPHPDPKVKMTRGKPIQVGPVAKLPADATWEKLAEMSPEEIKDKGVFPMGYLPLPHPKHDAGGMVFPQMEIKALPRLERFDVDFDLPEHFLPEFPPAVFLTTRNDLGDVSQGKLITVDNFQEIFQGILNAKDLEGVRMLVTQFPQQQFNATADRKTDKPDGMRGVACFDCHVNGHTSGATHLVGDIRPQSHRRRIDTPSLRGVNIQRLFGSQRALKNVEDFTEFEQRAAYFDGDQVSAAAKGINPLERAQPGPFHGGDAGPARLPAGAARRGRQARPEEVREGFAGDARPDAVLRQGPVRQLPPGAVLHRQPDARPPGRALLQDADDQRPGRHGAGADQDVHAARHQGIAAVPPRRPAADAGGHGGVLQPHPGDEADPRGEERPRGVHAPVVIASRTSRERERALSFKYLLALAAGPV